MKTTRSTYQKLSKEKREQIRKEAIRMWHHGESHENISFCLQISATTLNRLIAVWKKGGQNALKKMGSHQGKNGGPKRFLTPEMEKEILSMIVDHTPDQYKFEFSLWSREAVRQLIREKFKIDMANSTVGLYLKRWGLTVQRPAKQAMKKHNPKAAKAWLNHALPALREEAKTKGAELFFTDETAIQNVANYSRGYSPKGVTPVLKIQAKRMHINMISAISTSGMVKFALSSKSIDSDAFIDFADRLLREVGKPIVLVADNLRAHHSKKTQQWMKDHNDMISLHYFPAYSPELNPDEYLNNDLKHNMGSRAQAKTEKDLENIAMDFMSALEKDPEHVKSYFRHQKVKKSFL